MSCVRGGGDECKDRVFSGDGGGGSCKGVEVFSDGGGDVNGVGGGGLFPYH